ncbi:hypothetical protein RSAG8_10041, partial [Rhizoctonia solani AG-8 WAC10335]
MLLPVIALDFVLVGSVWAFPFDSRNVYSRQMNGLPGKNVQLEYDACHSTNLYVLYSADLPSARLCLPVRVTPRM